VWAARPIALVRELTKVHEQVLRGTAREVREALRADWRRGEMVLVLGGLTRVARTARPEHGEVE
jgi:16S rRNA (cytidine1402-2'-O)-methyltransferase